ncbi:hypothetical protein HYH02_004615 [Chlamydomonas schloesseri]|uniref:Uncharacterized protein n=1 Tax=Chlamydomonas schloesseri TaxID=2026947 RepID=A0A835WMZ5_9CHLO|nr:hypothetical protein HYH02_004615 [Chlamydomonas schloesseri]|eukprot:KAG2450778.1 hypothetical protein HYH02_004615 [Chlamydomonas schloesseri]
MLASPVTRAVAPARRSAVAVSAVAAPMPSVPPSKASSNGNGGGPRPVLNVKATIDDINVQLGAFMKQVASSSSLEKINKGIGKEISKAALDRFKRE